MDPTLLSGLSLKKFKNKVRRNIRMLRQFVDLVNEAVDDGYKYGIDLFMESLEIDNAKDEVLSEHGEDAVMKHLFENAGIEVIEENDDNEGE